MVTEHDDAAIALIADATAEIIIFWDDRGAHVYSVYALGMHPDPSSATAAAAELVETLSNAAFAGGSASYAGDRVRIVAGVSHMVPDPGFEDIRSWPLEGEDPGGWDQLDNGSGCKVFDPAVIELFRDAAQVTQWLHPIR